MMVVVTLELGKDSTQVPLTVDQQMRVMQISA